ANAFVLPWPLNGKCRFCLFAPNGAELSQFRRCANVSPIEEAIDDASHMMHPARVIHDERVRDCVCEAHPPALRIEPQEMIPKPVPLRRPELPDRPSPDLVIAHDRTSIWQ